MNSSGIVTVEVQLMRDFLPRSRPTRGTIEVGTGKPIPDYIKLAPGAGAVGTEEMMVYIENVTRADREWVSTRIGLTIDSTNIGEPRPAFIWIGGYADIPSAIVHYPVVAGYNNLMYRGRHQLLIRVVE